MNGDIEVVFTARTCKHFRAFWRAQLQLQVQLLELAQMFVHLEGVSKSIHNLKMSLNRPVTHKPRRINGRLRPLKRKRKFTFETKAWGSGAMIVGDPLPSLSSERGREAILPKYYGQELASVKLDCISITHDEYIFHEPS